MTKFIRIDEKGTWRGNEHRSCFAGTVFTQAEDDIKWEDGISCYSLDDIVEAIENLSSYWNHHVGLKLKEYDKMQITIFEGEKIKSYGFDGEDLAICNKTICEIEAKPFMKKFLELEEDFDFEDITEDEYIKEINKLVEEQLKGLI